LAVVHNLKHTLIIHNKKCLEQTSEKHYSFGQSPKLIKYTESGETSVPFLEQKNCREFIVEFSTYKREKYDA
jgi:hypothetical protein